MGTRRLTILASVVLVSAGTAAAGPAQERTNGQLLFVGTVIYGAHVVYDAGFGVLPNGARLRRLSAWEGPVGPEPVASPDGAKIAWETSNGIIVTDSAGRHPRRVTRRSATGVSWSPDGKRLAIVSFTPAISIVDLNGRLRQRFRTPGVKAWRVGWSPGGSTLAFQGDDGSGWELYRIHLSGSARRQLTRTGGDIGSFDWSPDGRRIVFSVSKLGGGASVWVMQADGTRSTRIVRTADEESSVAWSPNGRRIAYTASGRGIVIATTSGRRVGAIGIDGAVRVGRRAPRKLDVIDNLDWGAGDAGD